MLKSSLCDYSDAYILVKGRITVNNTTATDADANNTNEKVIFKNWALFANCISEINNIQIDNAKNIDIVIPMYNFISDDYSKTSGSLWQCYKDIPVVNSNRDVVEFNGANTTDSFNFKVEITGQTGDDGRINNLEMVVPSKYLSNFWRTLEMPLSNCEINLILTWSANCLMIYINAANQSPTFEITDAKLYVPVVTLLTQDNAKLLPQLKSSFKRTINWNKYLSKPEFLAQNLDLNHLVEPSFQGLDRRFVSAFENDAQRTSNKRHYLPNVEIKNYNVMIDGKTFFDQPVKSNKIAYENILKIAIGQGNDNTTGCLLGYAHLRDYYKMIAIDLSKQQALNDDSKAIQQINFTSNLDGAENTRIFFILEEAKETALDFWQGTVKVVY